MNKKTRYIISLTLNIIMVIITAIGLCVMIFNNHDSATGLTAKGFENLKFYTVLTNLSAGFVALYTSVYYIESKKETVPAHILFLKLMSVAGVGLTFFVVALFLGPIYGHSILYRDANLYFHLILPLVSMIEFVFLYIPKESLTFKHTFLTMIPPSIYGLAYLLNIMINGKGEWPNTNDWYGFLNWGLGVGLLIFLFIVIASWGISCGLRALNKQTSRLFLAQ